LEKKHLQNPTKKKTPFREVATNGYSKGLLTRGNDKKNQQGHRNLPKERKPQRPLGVEMNPPLSKGRGVLKGKKKKKTERDRGDIFEEITMGGVTSLFP